MAQTAFKKLFALLLIGLLATSAIATFEEEEFLNEDDEGEDFDNEELDEEEADDDDDYEGAVILRDIPADQGPEIVRLMLADAREALRKLLIQYDTEKDNYHTTMRTFENAIKAAKDICSGHAERLAELTEQWNEYNERIQEANASVADIRERLVSLDAQRCDANFIFIDSLRQTRNALSVIQIFKKWVVSAEFVDQVEQSTVFIAKLIQVLASDKILKDNAAGITDFLERIRGGDLAFLQIDQEWNEDEESSRRTAEQIGTGHVDNDRDEIAVRELQAHKAVSFDEVYQKLVVILDNLEHELSEKVTTLIANEVRAGEDLADYHILAEEEIDEHMAVVDDIIADFERISAELALFRLQTSDCGTKVSDIVNAQDTTKKNWEEREKHLEAQIKAHQDEIAALEKLLEEFEDTGESFFSGTSNFGDDDIAPPIHETQSRPDDLWEEEPEVQYPEEHFEEVETEGDGEEEEEDEEDVEGKNYYGEDEAPAGDEDEEEEEEEEEEEVEEEEEEDEEEEEEEEGEEDEEEEEGEESEEVEVGEWIVVEESEIVEEVEVLDPSSTEGESIIGDGEAPPDDEQGR